MSYFVQSELCTTDEQGRYFYKGTEIPESLLDKPVHEMSQKELRIVYYLLDSTVNPVFSATSLSSMAYGEENDMGVTTYFYQGQKLHDAMEQGKEFVDRLYHKAIHPLPEKPDFTVSPAIQNLASQIIVHGYTPAKAYKIVKQDSNVAARAITLEQIDFIEKHPDVVETAEYKKITAAAEKELAKISREEYASMKKYIQDYTDAVLLNQKIKKHMNNPIDMDQEIDQLGLEGLKAATAYENIKYAFQSIMNSKKVNKVAFLSGDIPDHIEIVKEYVILWQFKHPEGLFSMEGKSMLDRIVIDHKEKVAYIIDWKTTGKPVAQFNRSYATMGYIDQASVYHTAFASSQLYNSRLSGYRIEFYFVPVQFTGQLEEVQPKPVSMHDIKKARTGGILKSPALSPYVNNDGELQGLYTDKAETFLKNMEILNQFNNPGFNHVGWHNLLVKIWNKIQKDNPNSNAQPVVEQAYSPKKGITIMSI